MAAVITGDVELLVALDGSSSMNELAAQGSTKTRWDVVRGVMPYLVEGIEKLDAQKEFEETSAEAGEDTGEDEGGLWTVIYATGCTTLGDINTKNIDTNFPQNPPGGGTHITMGWKGLTDKYQKEFGHVDPSERPTALMIFLGDGEPSDEVQFEHILASVSGNTHVVVGVVGYGRDHDQAFVAYKRIAGANRNVHVLSFESETDGQEIANQILALVG